MSTQSSDMLDLPEKIRAFKRPTKKPFIVDYRAKAGSILFRGWHKFGAYPKLEVALGVLRQKQHDRYFEYRIRDV